MGLVWCLGRIIYAFGYSGDASTRFPGFALTIFPTLILVCWRSSASCRPGWRSA